VAVRSRFVKTAELQTNVQEKPVINVEEVNE
jgi:hypothetical protein